MPMLDARAAKSLSPGNHLTIDGAPGLRLVATHTRRSWIYRYKSPLDGLMRQFKIGAWPAMSLPAALARWEVLKNLRDAGKDPALERRDTRTAKRAEATKARQTVRALCDDYLAWYGGTVKDKTYDEAARLLSAEIVSIEDRSAVEIGRSDAFDLLAGMADRPVIAIRLRQLLGAVWDHALDAGRLPPNTANHWRAVMRGKLKSRGKKVAGENVGRIKRTLSEAELALLIPWLPNFTRDIRDALELYLWTCCRGAEIVAMERFEISEEVDGLWWTIPRVKLKMERVENLPDLRVPLVGRAEAVVRRRLAAHDHAFVFASRGKLGHIEQKAVGVAVWTHMPECQLRPEWVRPRLPVSAWAPHDLRRTGRTMLAAMGCPDAVAEAILGHLQPGIAGIYNTHSYDSERRDWLTRLSARLEAIACPAPATSRSLDETQRTPEDPARANPSVLH